MQTEFGTLTSSKNCVKIAFDLELLPSFGNIKYGVGISVMEVEVVVEVVFEVVFEVVVEVVVEVDDLVDDGC